MKCKAPNHLSTEAKGLWKRLTDEYEISDAAGLAILKTGLEAYDRAAACRQQIDRDGMVLEGRDNQKKAHPLLSIERDARAAFLAGLKALNLDLEPLRDRTGRP